MLDDKLSGDFSVCDSRLALGRLWTDLATLFCQDGHQLTLVPLMSTIHLAVDADELIVLYTEYLHWFVIMLAAQRYLQQYQGL